MREPVFHTGEWGRSCGFPGVDDGRNSPNRRTRLPKTGPEYDPFYTGYVGVVDRPTLAGVYVRYEGGAAREVFVTDSIGPVSQRLWTVEVPDGVGILGVRTEVDEASSHSVAIIFKGEETWGSVDIDALFEEIGRESEGRWLHRLQESF